MLPPGQRSRGNRTDQDVAEHAARITGHEGEDTYSEDIQPTLHPDCGSADGEHGGAGEVQCPQQAAHLDVPGYYLLCVRHGAFSFPVARDTGSRWALIEAGT